MKNDKTKETFSLYFVNVDFSFKLGFILIFVVS